MKFIDWLTPLRLKSRRRVERDLGSVQIANRLELLEDRSLLTAITIDYSFDANNFFDSQVKKDLMQLAADSIASRLTDSLLAIEPGPSGLGFDNTWTASFTHPATGDEGTVIDLMVPSDTLILFVGGRNLAGSTIGFGGPGGYDSSGTNEFLEAIAARGQDGSLLSPATDFGPWGGSITFDSDTNWFFGESIEGIGAAQSDFLSVAQHEVGHVLGMGTSAAWGTYVVGSNFTGPASMNANDGNAVVLNSDLSHWSQGTQSDGREATMTPAILNGTRGLFTNLDFAGLDDIGWDIAALPTLDALGNVTIDEDAAEQAVNLTGISAGGGESQPLRVTATSSNTGLIPNPTVTYTSANATGSVSFTPVADASGTATITVTVEDGGLDGDLDTTGDNATFSRTFDVTVSPVNDDPTLDALGNVTIDEDASEQTVNLAGISAGGGESQPLRVTATSSNTGLIPNPTVTYTSANATGSIAFTPVADASGMATITVTVEDGGLDGDLNTAGDNLTFSRTFDVTVSSVNDDPTLDALGNVTVDEDASEQTVNLTGISAGGGESQPLRVTATSSNTGLIPNPTVTYTSAETTGSLAFTPVADAIETVTITVTVEDGGLDGNLETAADNGQTVRTFAVHRTDPAAFYPSDTAITSGGSGSHSVSAVDLDGDGVTDFLAIRSENILRGVSIDGDGVPSTLFQMGTPSALGQYGTGLAIADFNGDGLNDLTDGVYVWKGNESGGLDSPDRIITAASNTLDVVAGDFDDDGHLDFVSLHFRGYPDGDGHAFLTLARGNGQGEFTLTDLQDTGRGGTTKRLAAGDFNGDEIDDVAFSNSNVFVVFGSPDRSYEIQPAASFSSDPVKALAAGDFNQDGRADLVIGQRLGDISVLLSDTDGNFSAPVLVHQGLPENTAWGQYGEVADIVVADFNSDGLLDIADVTSDGDDAHGNPTTAIVSLGDGHGGFSVRNVLSDNVNQTAVSLAAGDIDGDGDVDVLIGNYDSGRIGVLLNGDGTRFSSVSDLTLSEDTVSHELPITGITAGQNAPRPLRVTAVSSNPALLPEPTTSYTPGSTTATLNLAPVGDASGTATITVILEDGGADQDLATPFDNTVYQRDLLVTVSAVNDIPTLEELGNLKIGVTAPEQTVALGGISAGGGESQPLRVTASSSNTGLVPNPTVTYSSADATGSLAFIPLANVSGTATIAVTVQDGGLDGDLGTAGDNATFSRTFDVHINAIPTLDAISDISIDEDAPEQTVNLTGISAGGGEPQPLRVTASSSHTGLIPLPTVTYNSAEATGSIAFIPVPDASGMAAITVTVEDGGPDGDLGTAGDNATFSRTFEVTVNAVNDDPTLDAPANISLVSTGAETILNLSGISAGGSELQPLRITAASSDTDLLPDPLVTYTASEETGSLSFTVAAGRPGTATITLTVEDGGLDGELSTTGDNATITRTFGVAVEAGVDFGDAPDAASGTGPGNYNTTLADDGPRHLIVSTHATLFLGARVDGETDAVSSARADGDDVTGAGTDEEGLIEPAVNLWVTQGTSPVVRTRVTNLTGQTATLYGWIDYNVDGAFDNATERASVSVPSGVTAETVTLTFPVVPLDAITGTTYARFRLSTDTAAANPTGAADDGEVEDYVATVLRRSDGTVDVAKRTKIASLTNGGPLLADWNLFGRSVTSLGDIDGDGVNDLAVGAWYDSADGDRRGAMHVLFLNADGSVRDSTRIASEVNGGPVLSDIDHFGVSLASPGDLDRDGVNDLVVGAQDDDTGGTDRGAVYVLFLQSDGTVRDSVKIASGLNGGPELANEDKFGASVAALGDVDGDGVADLVVGASLDDSGGTNQGAVYILHMNADGTVRDSSRITSASHPNFEIPNWAWFGFSVASVGDLNGDGVTDIAVGALADDTGGTDRGAVHVVFLQEDGSVLDVTKIASSTNGGPALQDSDNFGASLASLGDLNGDGTTDIAVGSSLGNTGGTDRGAVHLLFLTDTGSVASYLELASDLNGVPSLTDDDRFGLSVAAAGDVDGDGVLDLAVGAVRDDTGGTNRGAVHLLFLNRANETPTLAALDALTLNQNAPSQTVSLSGIGAGAGESQPLQVTALSDNTSLIPNPTVTYASPETTGTIEFRPATGQSGTATITVTVEDGGIDGDLSTTSDNATFSRSFTVTINAGLNVIAELLPNATGQRVEIYASDSASITGLNLRVQLGDGTGAQSEPVFEGIDFTGSVFETFPTTVSGGPVNGAEQFLQASIVFDSAGNSVSASGLLATLIVDTTGFDSGSFELKFSATEIGADTALILPGGSEQSANLVNGYVRVLPAAVTGRHVFYNNSYFDGNSAAINAADDAAIATDKEPLFSGEVVTFANYTSYSRGINGVMIDLAGSRDAAALSLSDFVFRTGNVDNVTSWVTGATPDALLVREGAGADGVDRIVLTWPDGSFAGQWLEVTVRATAATGLAVPDIFYFGNAPGESGNSASNTFVDGTDFARARDNQRNFLNRAPIDFAMDYNRDSFVDGTDLAIARDSNTNFLTALRLLDLRLSSDASEMTGQQILSGSGQLSGSAQVSEASSAAAPAVVAAITSFPVAEDGQDDLAAGQPFASGAASTEPLPPQSASVTPGSEEPVTNDGAIVVQYDGGESSDVSLDSVDLLFESYALQVLVLEI
jgi:hypothetical protein